MSREVTRRAVVPAILVLLGVCGVSGCGAESPAEPPAPERSVDSFCETYWEQKDAYLSKFEGRAEDVEAAGQEDELLGTLMAMGSTIEAMGDVVIIFDHLAGTAPDDIRPDVEAIRDALQKSIDNASDSVGAPLGGLADGLVTGLSTMGSWERVGQYVVDNCGEQG